MRKRFGLWLIRTGKRLARIETPVFESWPSDALIARAKELSAEWDRPGLSGEHKRHQVFARLIKEYPDEDRKMLALAIELGLIS